jgi:flagellar motor component MotA
MPMLQVTIALWLFKLSFCIIWAAVAAFMVSAEFNDLVHSLHSIKQAFKTVIL